MTKRPRHPNKDLEAILRLAEDHGWTFEKGKRYYKGKCPCGVHMQTVHLTPSNPRYGLNLQKQLERQPCWKEKDDGSAR